jgi:hypothetical protein
MKKNNNNKMARPRKIKTGLNFSFETEKRSDGSHILTQHHHYYNASLKELCISGESQSKNKISFAFNRKIKLVAACYSSGKNSQGSQ